MIKDYFDNVSKIEENSDVTHCLQLAFISVVEILSGRRLTVEEAEFDTAYKKTGTWPYGMLLWFAENGFEVIHIENSNFEGFVQDPLAELSRQGAPEFDIQRLAKTDMSIESRIVDKLLRFERSTLVSRVPTVADVIKGLDSGWLPMVSLNDTVLNGGSTEVFDGHVVVATGHGDGMVRVQDSGPPAHWDREVSVEVLGLAMRSPNESAGTISLIRRLSNDEA